MKKCRLLSACMVAVAFTVALANVERASYQWQSAAGTGALEKEALVAIPFDSIIYEASRNDLGDVRIVDHHGQEVPYALVLNEIKEAHTVRETLDAEVLSLETKPGNQVEIEIALATNAASATTLEVVTPLKDFERSVSVWGGDGQGTWYELVTDAVIYDYSRFMDVRNMVIPLPENTARAYRIVVDKVSDRLEHALREITETAQGGAVQEVTTRKQVEQRPLRIDQIRLYDESGTSWSWEKVKVDYPVKGFLAAEEAAFPDATVIYVSTHREPLTALTLHTDHRNFSRTLKMQLESNGKWIHWAETRISKIQFLDHSREELKVSFPETRAARFRLVIENGDSPAFEIAGISLEGLQHQAVFPGEAGSSYTVLYGAEHEVPPDYDVERFLPSLREQYSLHLLNPGPPAANPAYDPDPSKGTLLDFLNGRVLFVVVIVLVVAVLAFSLFAAGKKLKELPVDEE